MDIVKNDILTGLEVAIDHRFSDRRLLEEALTHRSFLNESEEKEVKDNERLEFFGDAVIDFFLSHLLLERFPASREGELTKIRASLVGEENLGNLARMIELGTYLKLGRGEGKSGGREKRSILADAYEALVAAVYLDGGAAPVRRLAVPCYRHRDPSGPDHDRVFTVEVFIGDECFGKGSGKTKKEAEQSAARAGLDRLRAKVPAGGS